MPFFDSLHCGTSYHLRSPSEVTFPATWHSLKVISRIAHKLMALNFECISQFTTWWVAKCSKKYDKDIRKAHDRLFGQVFFKSLPKKDEFECWKEAINQKNKLLLIGNTEKVDVGQEEEDVDALVL
ncbi:hypothetical protein ACFX2G_019635 [Malus domestica]